jgi:hypothetical protein
MDGRKSATELMGAQKAPAKEKRRTKLRKFMKRMADAYRQLRERTSALLRRENQAKEVTYER